jgi:hypothetical protein
MRILMRTYIDAHEGSEVLKSGALQKVIQGFVETYKPEAAYYTGGDGTRSGLYVFDMKDSSLMPHIQEPFFMLGCRVTMTPCMSAEDLQKGLSSASL